MSCAHEKFKRIGKWRNQYRCVSCGEVFKPTELGINPRALGINPRARRRRQIEYFISLREKK